MNIGNVASKFFAGPGCGRMGGFRWAARQAAALFRSRPALGVHVVYLAAGARHVVRSCGSRIHDTRAGVALGAGKGYWRSQHVGVRARAVRRDTGVDIVKGCFFCSPSRELSRLGHLELDAEDDIAVSAMLARGRSRPHVVAATLRDALVLLPDVEGARKRRLGHRAAREAACRNFFRRV